MSSRKAYLWTWSNAENQNAVERFFTLFLGFRVSGTLFDNNVFLLAPEDLVIEGESSTELSLTFVPTKKSGADFYVANYKNGNNDTRCLLQASEHPLTCKYENLKPLTSYTFEYFAGAHASGSDIWSAKRFKTALTPADRKF